MSVEGAFISITWGFMALGSYLTFCILKHIKEKPPGAQTLLDGIHHQMLWIWMVQNWMVLLQVGFTKVVLRQKLSWDNLTQGKLFKDSLFTNGYGFQGNYWKLGIQIGGHGMDVWIWHLCVHIHKRSSSTNLCGDKNCVSFLPRCFRVSTWRLHPNGNKVSLKFPVFLARKHKLLKWSKSERSLFL